MKKYKCKLCGYVYDPFKGDSSQGVEPGTDFESLPAGWACPLCKTGKEFFIGQS